METKNDFKQVRLTFNLTNVQENMSCPTGGSTICLSPSSVCPPGTCVGTSTSSPIIRPLEMVALLRESQILTLHKQIQKLVMRLEK